MNTMLMTTTVDDHTCPQPQYYQPCWVQPFFVQPQPVINVFPVVWFQQEDSTTLKARIFDLENNVRELQRQLEELRHAHP